MMHGRSRFWGGTLLATLLFTSGCVSTGFGGSRKGDEDVWAIRCITLNGPNAYQLANEYATALRRVDGLNPSLVQVMSDQDGTAVYYGEYRRIYAREMEDVRYDPDPGPALQKVRELRLPNEQVWPFILATMDVLPTYRSAHPEWNLKKAKGYWSYHVAVFYNTPEFRSRRSAAEEYCQLLREQGWPAYYDHGPVNSSVYVGTYPKAAVVAMRSENPLTGRVKTTERIVDPEMLRVQEAFPTSLHNGFTFFERATNPRTGEVEKRLPAPSFPVRMPQAEARF